MQNHSSYSTILSSCSQIWKHTQQAGISNSPTHMAISRFLQGTPLQHIPQKLTNMEQNFHRGMKEQESIHSRSFKRVGCFPEKCSTNPQSTQPTFAHSRSCTVVQLCFPKILPTGHTNCNHLNNSQLAELSSFGKAVVWGLEFWRFYWLVGFCLIGFVWLVF